MVSRASHPSGPGLLCRCPDYDPFKDSRVTPEHYFVLDRLGEDGIGLDELHSLGDADVVGQLVSELIAWGAIHTVGGNETDFASGTPPAVVEGGLSRIERQRLMELKDALDSGQLLHALGVSDTTDKRALERAYSALAKQFDPSAYAAESMAEFQGIVNELHAMAVQALKALADSRTTTANRFGRQVHRRSHRMVFRGSIYACCVSWEKALKLTTQDLSDGGLFVVTERSAKVGETVVMEMQTKSGPLQLAGRVAWTRPASEAERLDMDPGFGVCLGLMSPETRVLWQRVLDKVRELQPFADPEIPNGEGTLAIGTGRYRRSPIIGIDLGTSYTSVSAMVNNRVSLLPWAGGASCIPSVVAFPARGRHVVGQKAKARLLTDPHHTVASVKRLLGRRSDDKEIQGHLGQVPYKTEIGPDGFIMTGMWGESYHMAQVVSYLLAAARETAEQALDTRVEKAVIAIPASFTPERLDMMRRAAKLAQLELVDVIEEPTAAALANRSAPNFGGLVGIYDFGGGTFDFSIVDATADFRVLATTGDSWLGGDDLDLSVADAAAELIWHARGVDLRTRVVEWQKLLFACEQAKRDLTSVERAEICVAEYQQGASGPMDLRMKLSRERAEELWSRAIERSLATCTQALHLLGLRPGDLSGIYLSGGTTYAPAVRRAVAERFRVPVRTVVPPEFGVCLGAGVHAATLQRRQPLRPA